MMLESPHELRMDTFADESRQACYEKACQGLGSFYVCVIEEEDNDGQVRLLAHETPLLHALFCDAKERQQKSARHSKTWIAKCTIMPETEMEQSPVTAEELAYLFTVLRDHPDGFSQKRAIRARVRAWLDQQQQD